MTKLESLIKAIRSHRSPPENWTHYNDGFNQGLEVAITEVVRALQDEPGGDLRTGDYVDVGGEPGLAVFPPHVLVLWQNRRTSLVPLGAIQKTQAAPVGIGAEDVTEARKLGPGGCAQNRQAEPKAHHAGDAIVGKTLREIGECTCGELWWQTMQKKHRPGCPSENREGKPHD